MIVVVFRIRLNPGVESEFYERLEEMLELASKEAPGLQGLKADKSDDGELAYVIEWDNEENLSAWRNHPVHPIAVGRGGRSSTPATRYRSARSSAGMSSPNLPV